MKHMSETIVFFGSGPVAAASLRLLAEDFAIEAVVTKSRPAHHKGDVPVLVAASELGFKVLEASDQAELDKLFATKPATSRLAVLIDFGIIVSKPIIDYFPLGIINSHFSVLPEWRGADPITFAILSGQSSTGVSLMRLVTTMDEGPLLAYGEYELPPDITTPLLTEHLIHFSHQLLVDKLPKYIKDSTTATQAVTGRQVSYSRKLTKQDGVIDWHKPALQLEREVRAYAGWPRSRTKLGNTDVIITKAHIAPGSGRPGSLWFQAGARHAAPFGIYTAQDILVIDNLSPAGKKEMAASAFLAGYHI